MEAYTSETSKAIKRFLSRKLSFHDCIAALDTAFARLSTRERDTQSAPIESQLVLGEPHEYCHFPVTVKTSAGRGKAVCYASCLRLCAMCGPFMAYWRFFS